MQTCRHETVCGAMARMSGCVAVVLQCLFDLNTVCRKSTVVSLDCWCCAELALVVIFAATVPRQLGVSLVSGATPLEDCAGLQLRVLDMQIIDSLRRPRDTLRIAFGTKGVCAKWLSPSVRLRRQHVEVIPKRD